MFSQLHARWFMFTLQVGMALNEATLPLLLFSASAAVPFLLLLMFFFINRLGHVSLSSSPIVMFADNLNNVFNIDCNVQLDHKKQLPYFYTKRANHKRKF